MKRSYAQDINKIIIRDSKVEHNFKNKFQIPQKIDLLDERKKRINKSKDIIGSVKESREYFRKLDKRDKIVKYL